MIKTVYFRYFEKATKFEKISHLYREFSLFANFITADFITAIFQNYWYRLIIFRSTHYFANSAKSRILFFKYVSVCALTLQTFLVIFFVLSLFVYSLFCRRRTTLDSSTEAYQFFSDCNETDSVIKVGGTIWQRSLGPL